MQGLQVFDEDGDAVLDVTDRVTKILGEIIIPKDMEVGSGSIVDPNITTGTPFYFCVGNETLKSGNIDPKGWHHGFWQKTNDAGVGYYPVYEIPAYNVDVQFNGTRVDWSVEKYAKWWVNIKNESMRILYGVY